MKLLIENFFLENVDGTLCSVLIFSISDDLNKNKYDLAHKFRDFGLATEVFHETNFSIDYVLVCYLILMYNR